MKKTLALFVAVLFLGAAVFVATHKPSNQGAVGGMVETIAKYFQAGFYAGTTNQLSVDSSGNVSTSGTFAAGNTTITGTLTTSGTSTAKSVATATVGSSSSSPAALGSASAGHFIIAAGQTTANASTTSVTANSSIFITQENVTPIAGTTCKSGNATSTISVSGLWAGNGFQVKQSAADAAAVCLTYRIVN